MLEDSQRDNTDLKARACEEKSVVINTHCLHVDTIAGTVHGDEPMVQRQCRPFRLSRYHRRS